MGGLAPLSYTTVRDWAELMDIPIRPLEVKALILLDAVMRHPETDEPEEEPEKPDHAWPEKNDG